MEFEINATTRTLTGTGASRRLRRADKVPGIVYGGKKTPEMIELSHKDMMLALAKEAFHASVLSLKLDGKAQSVLLRDTQFHPYKRRVLHIDFLRIDEKETITVKVPLHFLNQDTSPGVKLNGGSVSHILNEIEISCLPKDLPQYIEVDLGELDIGQSIHLNEIKLPEGVSGILHDTDQDPVVASITVKRGGSDIDDEAVDAAEGGATEEGDTSASADKADADSDAS